MCSASQFFSITGWLRAHTSHSSGDFFFASFSRAIFLLSASFSFCADSTNFRTVSVPMFTSGLCYVCLCLYELGAQHVGKQNENHNALMLQKNQTVLNHPTSCCISCVFFELLVFLSLASIDDWCSNSSCGCFSC